MAKANSIDQKRQGKPGNHNTPAAQGWIMSTGKVLDVLWERAGDRLSPEELEWFAMASDHAEHMALQLQKTVENLGVLLVNDENTGAFDDVGNTGALLFHITNTLDTIRALIHVGESASFYRHDPELHRAIIARSQRPRS